MNQNYKKKLELKFLIISLFFLGTVTMLYPKKNLEDKTTFRSYGYLAQSFGSNSFAFLPIGAKVLLGLEFGNKSMGTYAYGAFGFGLGNYLSFGLDYGVFYRFFTLDYTFSTQKIGVDPGNYYQSHNFNIGSRFAVSDNVYIWFILGKSFKNDFSFSKMSDGIVEDFLRNGFHIEFRIRKRSMY